MKTVLTYVVHNCFCLEIDKSVLVFDYPAKAHRPASAKETVRQATAGKDAYVLFSHSHGDHCSPEVMDALGDARSTNFILSYDVPDMVPELDIPEAIVVEPGDGIAGGEPGEELAIGDVRVFAIESNDLGVAFFITVQGVRVYFGGDLAAWVWPESTAVAQKQTQAFFDNSVKTVADFAPHIAFTDCDHRLPNRTGYEEFMRAVEPAFCVPMHDFGDPANNREYVESLTDMPGTLMQFGESGDSIEIEVDTSY